MKRYLFFVLFISCVFLIESTVTARQSHGPFYDSGLECMERNSNLRDAALQCVEEGGDCQGLWDQWHAVIDQCWKEAGEKYPIEMK